MVWACIEKRIEYIGKRMTEVPGERRRGRPKRMWLDNINNDLSERELSGSDRGGSAIPS